AARVDPIERESLRGVAWLGSHRGGRHPSWRRGWTPSREEHRVGSRCIEAGRQGCGGRRDAARAAVMGACRGDRPLRSAFAEESRLDGSTMERLEWVELGSGATNEGPECGSRVDGTTNERLEWWEEGGGTT